MFFTEKDGKDENDFFLFLSTFVNDGVVGRLARKTACIDLPATKVKRYGWPAIMMWHNKELSRIAPASVYRLSIELFSIFTVTAVIVGVAGYASFYPPLHSFGLRVCNQTDFLAALTARVVGPRAEYDFDNTAFYDNPYLLTGSSGTIPSLRISLSRLTANFRNRPNQNGIGNLCGRDENSDVYQFAQITPGDGTGIFEVVLPG